MFQLHRPAAVVFLALVGLAVIAAINPPRAEASPRSKYAAIAYSEQTGRYGYAYGYNALQNAEDDAIANCDAPDAEVVTWVENGWVALALGDDGAYGYSWSTQSLADAEAVALQNCPGNNACIAAWAAAR